MKFLKSTAKNFFVKDGSKDFLYFFIGLVALLIFTRVYMYEAEFLFPLGMGVLTSALFSYICTDASFKEERKYLRDFRSRLSYIIAKDIFTFLFVGLVFLLVGFISTLGAKANFYKFLSHILLVLAGSNIILVYNNKILGSYKPGRKRNPKVDIKIGTKALIAFIPYLVLNIILLFFIGRLNVILSLGLFLISILSFAINATNL